MVIIFSTFKGNIYYVRSLKTTKKPKMAEPPIPMAPSASTDPKWQEAT
jgi:hypothetical protein